MKKTLEKIMLVMYNGCINEKGGGKYDFGLTEADSA